MEKPEIQNTAYFLTKTIMSAIFQENLDENMLNTLCERLGVYSQDVKIFFYTQLMLTLRKYPDTLFSSPDVRTEFLHVIQENLDRLILEESDI